ncbi:MAG: IS110 family transposase [Actinomycetota bacterium]
MPLSTVLYVGTDVSQAVSCTQFFDAAGDEVGRRFESANDLPGAKALAAEAILRADTLGADEIRWALEATNLFWWHLATYLTSSPELNARGLKLYSFNPRVVAKFRESYPDLGKDDWADAMVIADRLRFGRLPAECYLDERYQPLQRFTRYRKHLVDTIVREKQVALGYIWLKLSGYELEEDGHTNTFGATSQAILERYLTPDEIVATPFEELASLIATESRGRADADAVARAVQHAALRSYRLPGRIESLTRR